MEGDVPCERVVRSPERSTERQPSACPQGTHPVPPQSGPLLPQTHQSAEAGPVVVGSPPGGASDSTRRAAVAADSLAWSTTPGGDSAELGRWADTVVRLCAAAMSAPFDASPPTRARDGRGRRVARLLSGGERGEDRFGGDAAVFLDALPDWDEERSGVAGFAGGDGLGFAGGAASGFPALRTPASAAPSPTATCFRNRLAARFASLNSLRICFTSAFASRRRRLVAFAARSAVASSCWSWRACGRAADLFLGDFFFCMEISATAPGRASVTQP